MRTAQVEREADIKAVVLAQRELMASGVGSKMRETSTLGRLEATGEITYRQYVALRQYREAAANYQRAILVRPVTSAGDLNRTHGHDASEGDDPDYVRTYNLAVREFEQSKDVLRACYDKLTLSVVNAVVLSDLDAAYFIGALREGSNALARLYRVPEYKDEPHEAEPA